MSDLIKREDAIKALRERWARTVSYDGIGEDIGEECEDVIKTIPSADRPQGEWIEHKERTIVRDNNFIDFFPTEYECSNCGLRHTAYFINSALSNYCPNCGARMFAKDINVPNKKGADDGNK